MNFRFRRQPTHVRVPTIICEDCRRQQATDGLESDNAPRWCGECKLLHPDAVRLVAPDVGPPKGCSLLRAAGAAEEAAKRHPRAPNTEEADGAGAAMAEVEQRGLVRRDSAFTSRHKGVSWSKTTSKWQARVYRGGKPEYLGSFATEEEAKARRDFSLV